MKFRMFNLAQKAALSSTNPRYKVGAVVAKKNMVISFGANAEGKKTHPRSYNIWKSIHAEHDALMNTGIANLKGSEIYVVRITKSGLPATSRPCKDCIRMLKTYGIKMMHYVNKERRFTSESVF